MADKAMASLHSLSDKELLNYFPGTTREELKTFRYNYPPFIVKELKKGNYPVFKELDLTPGLLAETQALMDKEKGEGTFYQILIKICSDKTEEMKEKRRTIIQYLLEKDQFQLGRATVLALLNFHLDTDNEENQALELNAFQALRKKDFGLLRELVVGVIEDPPDEATSLNAVYVFKYIN